MYNEPVLFCRIMAVHDIGKQELISTDGRKFKVIHLVDGTGATYEGFKYDSYDRETFLSSSSYASSFRSLRYQFFYNGKWTRGYYLGEEKKD